MNKRPKLRLYFWHKLLIALGGAMIFLALGLTIAAMTTIRHAGSEIGVKAKDILASQTERFLTNLVNGQSDTIDLQLEQGRLSAIYGASSIQNMLKSDEMPDTAFFSSLLANAGDFSTTVYYASIDGKVTYYPRPEEILNRDGSLPYSSIVAYHFSDFPDNPNPVIPTLWSDIHRNPYTVPYDRVVDALAPVYDPHGRLKGYLGVSISVIRLVAQFNQRQTIRGSYSFLVDERRMLISGPPNAIIEIAPESSHQALRNVIDLNQTENEDLDQALGDMVLGDTAVKRIKINDRWKYLAYRPLGRVPWSLGLAVPESLATVASEQLVHLIDDKGEQALNRMLLTTLIFLGGVLIAVGLITRRMTQPLLDMADIADHVARGELEHKIDIASSDEIGELAQAFNVMTQQLKHYIGSLEHQRQELYESETRYRALFENSPISLWEEDFSHVKRYLDDLRNQGVRDFDQYFTEHPEKVHYCAKLVRIVDVNDATVKMYSANDKSELLGSLPIVLTDTAMDVLKKELVAIAEGRMFEIECTNKTLDNRELTIVLRSLVPPGYEDSWRKVFVAVNDITARANAQKENKRLEEQLRQAYKMEAIGTLAGGIAHDFNNILSAILGYTELLDSQIDPNSKNRQYTHQVLQAAHRAKDLVNQILAYSRQTEQVSKPVPVKQVVTEAMKLLRASLPSTIEIDQALHSEGVVMSDATQIHQVVMNLCTNAGQAMQKDGGVLRVRLNEIFIDTALKREDFELPAGAYVKLQIADNGYGMPAETMKRIFDPFFTTKNRHQGTGMGLAVVHGIIQSSGGKIDVQSVPGRGSTFDVYLPSVDAAESPAASPVRTSLPRGSESILFVDDEETLADLGCMMLNQFGYRVTTFTSSLSALEALEKSPQSFDLVITDMTMPHMTGDKLSKAIHDIDADKPIIMCSGFSENLERLKKSGHFSGFLMKPLEMSALASTVRKVLDDDRCGKAKKN